MVSGLGCRDARWPTKGCWDLLESIPNPPRYPLYGVLEPLGPFIVGTWGVKGMSGILD